MAKMPEMPTQNNNTIFQFNRMVMQQKYVFKGKKLRKVKKWT